MSRFDARHFLAVVLLLSPISPGLAQETSPVPPEKHGIRRDLQGDPLPEGAVARIGTLRLRQLGEVSGLGFTADGTKLVSMGADHSFYVWETATGRELHRFNLKPPATPELEQDVTNRFNILQLQFLLHEAGRKTIPAITAVFSPDGKYVALGDAKGTIQLRDLAANKQLHSFDVKEAQAPALIFSPDSRILVGARSGEAGLVYLWDVASGKELAQLTLPPRRGIQRLAFTSDGARLAGASGDEIYLWELATGKRIRVYQGHDKPIFALAFAPGGKRLVSVSEDRSIRFWDDQSAEEAAKVTAPAELLSVAFSPDGQLLATGDKENQVRLWDAATGKVLRKLSGHSGPVAAVAFAPDGMTLTSASQQGIIRLWDTATGNERLSVEHFSQVLGASFFDTSGQVALRESDGIIRLCNPGTGKVVRQFPAPKGSIACTWHGPAGQILALLNVAKDVVQVWDVVQNKELRVLEAHPQGIVRAVFSPDGKVLASAAGDQTLRLWNVATGKELHRLVNPTGFRALAFSPNGKILAAAAMDHNVVLYETSTGKERLRFPAHSSGLTGVAFSPDGRLLGTSSMDQTVRTWDVFTGSPLTVSVGHRGTVWAVAFSPDGTLLASAGDDQTVRLWKAVTGEELSLLSGHRGTVTTVAFSPDGKRLVSGSHDTTALVWDVAKARMNRASGQAPPRKLDEMWAGLASEDAAVAFRAIGGLIRTPKEAVAFLQERIQMVPEVKPERLAQLIADLDHDRYAMREMAMVELARLEGQAEPALRKALAARPSPEAVKRLQTLLDRRDKPVATPESLRTERAMEVLEQIGTAEARHLMDSLARGAPGALLTQLAREAVQRLGQHRP